MNNQISPSMMCVNFSQMAQVIKDFEEKKIEYLHIDIMDGEFVPNYTLGVDFCKKVREMTRIPLDIHLMIKNPENKLDWFDIQPNEYVSVHLESTVHIQRALAKIRMLGAKPMIALNPGTPVHMIENILDDIDAVLIMTVNPGYSGQKLIPATLQKIIQTRKYLNSHGHKEIEIEVDGNVSFENAAKMKEAMANIFVGGTSSVFNSQSSIPKNIDRLRTILDD